MKKALISPDEIVHSYPDKTGQRVAQIEEETNIFDVSAPLFWKTCPDNILANEYFYDPSIDTYVKVEYPPQEPLVLKK